MEILFISHKYPPSIGGMQKQSFELIEGFKKKHTVHAIIYRSGYPKLFFILFAWFGAWIKCLLHPDIKLIHINDGLMAFFLSPLLFLVDKKLVVTIHGLDVVFPLGVYQRWVKTVLTKFDMIITVSRETGEECIKRGIPPKKVVFIPNGFEPLPQTEEINDFSELSRYLNTDLAQKKIILSVGRPVTRKGFSWFINQVLPSLHNDALYVISGPKEKNKQLIRWLKKLPENLYSKLVLFLGLGVDELEIDAALAYDHMKDRVLYLGKTDPHILALLRKKAYLFVMPNLHVEGDFEGFGLVALEAVSAGTLCIASATDGIPSAIQHQQNGFLLSPEDPLLWIETINRLLEDPAQKQKQADKFRNNLNRSSYTWSIMCERYAELFIKIIN